MRARPRAALLMTLAACSPFSAVPDGADAGTTPLEAGNPGNPPSADASLPPCDPTKLRPDDGKNCGGCYRDCLGGACMNGQCSVVTLVAKLPSSPYYLRADATHLYTGTDIVDVFRIEKSTGKVETIATGLDKPRAVVPDGDSVLIATQKGVFQAPKTGGVPALVTEPMPFIEVAATGTDFFFACDFQRKVLTRYGKTTASAPSEYAKENLKCESIAAVAANEVYFGGLVIGHAKGPVGELFQLTDFEARRIAVDDAHVYSITHGGTQVKYARRDGTLTEDLSASPVRNGEGDIAADATHVYWAMGVENGAVYRSPKQRLGPTANPPELVAGELARPVGIAVDDKAIYWSERASGAIRLRAK